MQSNLYMFCHCSILYWYLHRTFTHGCFICMLRVNARINMTLMLIHHKCVRPAVELLSGSTGKYMLLKYIYLRVYMLGNIVFGVFKSTLNVYKWNRYYTIITMSSSEYNNTCTVWCSTWIANAIIVLKINSWSGLTNFI